MDRRRFQPFMPEFMTDLLSGVLVTQSLAGIELNFIRATDRRRLTSYQHLVSNEWFGWVL